MKKITAFFLALFPIFVIILLFVSGMIVKQYTHIFVTSVEFTEDSWVLPYTQNDPYPTGSHQLVANVLPFNASNPGVYYESTDPEVASVDDHGFVTVHDFGETDIYAFSRENESIYAKCPVKITDDKVHRIDIVNKVEGSYLGRNESVHLDARPIPNDELNESIDPTVYFKINSGADYIDLSSVGDLIAKNEVTPTPAKIEAYIPEQGEVQPSMSQPMEVNVGLGVTSIDLDNPSNEFIKEDKYNLFDQIITYPENKADGRIAAGDFEYISSDETIADESETETGVIEFKKPGKVQFEIVYKRNRELSRTKEIESSCLYLTDVSFNRYNFEGSYTELHDQTIDKDDLNWHVYPLANNPSEQANADAEINITSDNTDVIQVIDEGNETKLKVVGYGLANIKAEIKLDEQTTKFDNCLVHIQNDQEGRKLILQDKVKFSDSYIYPLRKNLNIDQFANPNEEVEWATEDTSGAFELDKENETLTFHRSNEGTPATITATVESKTYSFTVECLFKDPVQDVTVSEDFQTVMMEAGKPYRLVDVAGHNLSPLYAEVPDDFWYDPATNIYIPKHGLSTREMFLYSDSWIIPAFDIYVIATQDPIGIVSNGSYPYYVTPSSSVSVTPQLTSQELSNGQFDVYPRSSIDKTGKKYRPTISYSFDDPQTGYVDVGEIYGEQIVNFTKAGYVDMTIQAGSEMQKYTIKSTFGKLGKFSLQDNTTNKIIQSGDKITLSQSGGATVLTLAEKFSSDEIDLERYGIKPEDIKCTSDVVSCVPSVVNNQLFLTITPNSKYGSDVIKIDAGLFTFYLNVEVTDPQVQALNLYYHGQKLKAGTDVSNLSYAHKLELGVEALPLKSDETVTAQFDGNDISIVDGMISLGEADLTDGNHTVTLDTEHLEPVVYKLEVKPITAITDFVIKEAKLDNTIYIPCAATQFGLTILIEDALIDDALFTDQYWNIAFDDQGLLPQLHGNRCSVTGVPRATNDTPGYDANLTITFNSQITKQYKISRDVVSKIILPNHDNNSFEDQKGLQRIHVFGNQSVYTPEEGKVDFYRLPIEIYDYHGKLVDNTQLKSIYYNTLNVSYRSLTKTYERPAYNAEHDCIEIKFDWGNLYTPMEIYNNAFEFQYKNMFYSVSTYSGLAGDKYSFVPVNGVNAYCQEAFAHDENMILQTNFGIEGATKDNMPFTIKENLDLGDLYGNGYTLNIDSLYRKFGDSPNFSAGNMINITLMGCNDSHLRTQSQKLRPSGPRDGELNGRFIAYCNIRNFAEGIVIMRSHVGEIWLKNNLIYNNLYTSIQVQSDDDYKPEIKCYVENCVLFNCSATAFTLFRGGQVFLKGSVDVFNFRNRDALKIMDYDFGFLWDDFILPILESKGAIQEGADGRKYFNSCMATYQGSVFFWDEATKSYIESEKGTPSACPYLTKIIDVSVPGLLDKTSLWGTLSPIYEEGAPSYYDEFDDRGDLRWDFLNAQIQKLYRPVAHWHSLI